MSQLRRNIPTIERLAERKAFFDGLALRDDAEAISLASAGLEHGNGKTGSGGLVFSKVFVWNLPMKATCPGMSGWCRANCYNADSRTDVYPIDRWERNLRFFLQRPGELAGLIERQLDEARNGCVAVRLHSSGDFFSEEYVTFWINIASDFPGVRFWGYTRSWAVGRLWAPLRILAGLENVSLIWSWDATMRAMPDGSPRSLVFGSVDAMLSHERENGGHVCPEQFAGGPCCCDCGYCALDPQDDVLFVEH